LYIDRHTHHRNLEKVRGLFVLQAFGFRDKEH